MKIDISGTEQKKSRQSISHAESFNGTTELHKLTQEFKGLTASQKKEILKYLSYIKTEEVLLKNVDKVIRQLKNKEKHVRIP